MPVQSHRRLLRRGTEWCVALRSDSRQVQIHSKGCSPVRRQSARKARRIVGHDAVIDLQELADTGIRHSM
ncbi:hypothetical protein MRX96_034170 [Rhipicephalus microplus]